MNTEGKEKGLSSRLAKLLAAGALMVTALAVSQGAVAGISATKHNLGSTQATAGNNRNTGTGEICVFCHTPHASNTTAPAPLWNKNYSGTTYTMYASTTLDAQVKNVGGISLACLSCHDGTQAMDNVINAPGSGLGTGRISGTGWAGDRVDGNGQILSTAITNLSTDLSNDHPVGIPYCGDATKTNYTCNNTSSDKDFNTVQKNGASTMFWVDSIGVGASGNRDKTDMILYPRTVSATDYLMVECASCHDPHSSNPTFLRIENTGSAVCLTCHNK